MAEPYLYFGLSCPSGGNFYICENNATEFIGCCTTNPCESNGKCPKANLRAASFSADKYTDLERQDCDDAASIQMWYTCKSNKPPFMGCCASNPCAEGLCPPTDLRPAKLSGDLESKAKFLRPGGIAPSSTTSSASPASTVTNTAATSTTSSTSLSGGAIGGICAAAAGVLIMTVGVGIWYARRKRQQQAAPTPANVPTGEPSPVVWKNGYCYQGKPHTISRYGFPASLMQRRRVQREQNRNIHGRDVVAQPTITSPGHAVYPGV